MVNESVNKKTSKGRPPKASTNKKAEVVKEEVVEDIIQEEAETSVVEDIQEIKEEPKKEKETKTEPVKTEKTKKEFNPTDSITCRSVVSGGLYMDGIVSSMPYTWSDFGDEVGVEYRDLVAAVKKKNSYVMKPFFVIMDDDFVAEFPFLKDIYSGQYSITDLANVLTLDIDDMVDEIKKLPGNVKETLKGIASTWVSNGRLDSFKKIKALDNILDTDLSLIADMANE